MTQDFITIKGARQHNLKNISIQIPRNKLVVITGLSGSGKSSLAFDTLYAEGQRRYVESLSAYARQFLDQLQKPDVEHIEGLSPAIAIEQRASGSSPRSTVATTTEIYDYLRLLYANIGKPHCPECGRLLQAQSAQAIVQQLLQLPRGKKLFILAPVIQGRKGEHKEIFERLSTDGFLRCRVDGKLYEIDELPALDKKKNHTIDVVIDRLIAGECDATRLQDTVETTLKYGEGNLIYLLENNEPKKLFTEEKLSEHLACVKCGCSFGKLQPRHFSFNSPHGACPHCNGIGSLLIADVKRVLLHPECSIRNGAVPDWRKGSRNVIMLYNHYLTCLALHWDFPKLMTTPWQKLPEKIQHNLLHGTTEEVVFDYTMRGKKHAWRKPFEGILNNLERRFKETELDSVRERLRALMVYQLCPTCKGGRLKPEYLAVTVGEKSIQQFNAMPIDEALDFIQKLKLSEYENAIAREIVKEVTERLSFLKNVGLNYLSLDRESTTLSGGEAQRIRLASQLGAGLVGVLYILDEPSIGLHQRDNDRLIATLKQLRDAGNTVLVVEHDLDTIRAADFVIDLGPGAGRHGGEIVGFGTPDELRKNQKAVTGRFLAGTDFIKIPEKRHTGNGQFLTLKKCTKNNLKKVDLSIPLGTFCCITGVSGSGKSSLIDETLRPILEASLRKEEFNATCCQCVNGLNNIQRLISIDQSPIGRTPRSNPATYTDAFSPIRNLFAQLPESKARGFTPGRFSFNVKGGRCESCRGDGIKKIEMLFLPDVFVRCEDCNGLRFNADTRSIKFKKQSISDVLNMTVDDALELFKNQKMIARKLQSLQDVGLGYIHLGQASTTLSGGEAQRVKLATELAKVPKGHTLYILDEPTTGLHLADIKHLLSIIYRLRDMGHTVLVIEHNLDVIKTADHIIDLGPEGGRDGGQIIAQGTPETVAKNKKSYTAKYLQRELKR